jgi:hypothetical protein
VKLLRAVLYAQAAVWATCGAAVAAVPHFVIHDLFGQPRYADYAYVRVSGILSVGFALVMVLVAQRLEEVWWWAWAFIITTAGIVTVTGLNALVGPLTGSDLWLWWLFAGVNAVLLAVMLLGMGRAAQEKPFA